MNRIFTVLANAIKKNRFFNTVSATLAAVGIMAITTLSAAPAAACHCQTLNVTSVDRDTFNFTSGLNTLGGGSIVKVIYNFGDGTTTENTNPSAVVTHKYVMPGKFTARVTIFLKLNGKIEELTGNVCTKPVEVKPAPPEPRFECTVLEATKITRTKYSFKVSGSAENGATIEGANFDFGDKTNTVGIKTAAGNSVMAEHEYKTAGDFTAVAALTIKVNGNTQIVTSEKCTAKVVVPVEECKPGVPVGSTTCQPTPPPTPTPTPPTAPTPAPVAVAPAELPATGPTEILGGMTGLGGITAAGVNYARARHSLRNSFRR
ncbi:MAG TPA: PKD domain-containing protein [Patescibacteria group bacterium]|nr:PKD domain-containing protein [Patescibacteria group bacterium]